MSLSAVDLAAIHAAVDADAAAVRRGDWDAVAGMFTEDAVRFPPNEPVLRGRPAIRAWLGKAPRFADFRITADAIIGSGDLAYVRGRYEMRVDGPPPMHDRGNYTGLMRRQPDGRWLWTEDMAASELPPLGHR